MTPTGSPGRIEMLNGVPIYFEVHGSGEPLLLLHGFSGCSQDWSAFVEEQKDSTQEKFQLIIPDLRGHGRSFAPTGGGLGGTKSAQPGVTLLPKFAAWRHDEAMADMFALLDHLGIETFKGIGVSGGGNVLLHMATKEPERVKAMVLVSATSYFPDQARPIMRQYADNLPAAKRENLRRRHPGGDSQIEALVTSTKAFADSYDDMNFTPPCLGRITARTLIVQGDRDPLYPLEISMEMARAIPRSSLWIVPNSGHGPVLGQRWPEFLKTAAGFVRG